MIPKHQRQCRRPWLVVTIASVVLWSQIAEPILAKPRPAEITNAAVQRDLVYKRINGRALMLDLYCPQKASGRSPVILWINAGGWSHGRKEQHIPVISFVNDGYTVASIELRLSGEAPFPAQIEDCKAAVRWLRANAAKYNLDADRIGAAGHSGADISLRCLALLAEYRSCRETEITCLIQAACKPCAMRPARQIFCVSTTMYRTRRPGRSPKPYLTSMRYWAGRPSKIKRRRSRRAQLLTFPKMIRLFSSSTGRTTFRCRPVKASY